MKWVVGNESKMVEKEGEREGETKTRRASIPTERMILLKYFVDTIRASRVTSHTHEKARRSTWLRSEHKFVPNNSGNLPREKEREIERKLEEKEIFSIDFIHVNSPVC